MSQLKELYDSQQIKARADPLDLVFGSKPMAVEATDDSEEEEIST